LAKTVHSVVKKMSNAVNLQNLLLKISISQYHIRLLHMSIVFDLEQRNLAW